MPVPIERATAFGVIPVVEIDDLGRADALAETLLEAGLGVVEVTFRTEAAADIVARLADRHPDLLVGAGTVTTEADIDRALAAGAKFALAPGLSAATATRAQDAGLPYIPGIMTPSDLQAGVALGLSTFKFFPALPAGGLTLLRAIAAPFVMQRPRFIPTGGITQASLREWLDEPAVAAVGGTWIASRRAIAAADWRGIAAAARAALHIARQAGRLA
jgi:2-dehydro-3-deoxyphosphogluconate aldolase/(4S)-4-hydroxy-2-oxoglutarate aldolase